MGAAAGPDIVEDGLVLCLDAANERSYPGSGNTWYDLSGNGNDGTLVNGVGYSGNNNGSMVFDGVDDYIIKTVFNNVPFGAHLTINVLIYPTNIGGDTKRLVCQARRPQSTNGEYLYGITPSGYQNYWDYNNINGGYGFKTNVSSSIQLQNNNYYNLTFTKDTSTGKFYVNGLFDTQVTATGPAGGSVEFVNDDFVIGNDHRCLCNQFGGNIYSVQVYNRALSDTEIKQNFEATRSRYEI